MKTCFKCNTEKPLIEFYGHPRMADGHLNKCKECTKADVRRWYGETLPQRHHYDRGRSRLPERRAARVESLRRQHERNPHKTAARQAVARAVRKGTLIRQPCEVCGVAEVEAHHEDYLRPLDVRWLCFKHHREVGHGQRVTAVA